MRSRRSRRLRRKVIRGTDDLRDRITSIGAAAATLAGEVPEQLQQVPDRIQRLPAHVEHARAVVEDRLELAEPYVRRGGIGLLSAAQALIGVAVALPRLVARSLTIARILAERAEIAQERGQQFADRARDLAHRVEPSRRQQRRRRLRGALLVSAGFAVGFVLGWIMADGKGLAAREQDRETAAGHAAEVARRDAEVADGEPTAPRVLHDTGPRRVTVIEGGTPAR